MTIRYDSHWARGASNAALQTLTKDTPPSQETMVDWRAVAAELVRRLEVAETEVAAYERDYGD
jgi:hypothetical protein